VSQDLADVVAAAAKEGDAGVALAAQGATAVFRVDELLNRQRTQAINALPGHLTEFGLVVARGAANVARLDVLISDPENGLPKQAVTPLQVLADAIASSDAEIATLDTGIRLRAKENEVARRLMPIPGIGPLIATAIAVLTPPPTC